MTRNREPNNANAEPARERTEHRLPYELDVAMRHARDRQPGSGEIIRCIRNAKRLGEGIAPEPRLALAPRVAWYMTIAGSLAAAAVYLLVTWHPWSAQPERDSSPAVSLSQPVYSPVNRVPLVAVGYQRIETDLDQADGELEQASEAMALSAVRFEVQQTLEEFYDWSEPGK